jgi:uncharacterized protein
VSNGLGTQGITEQDIADYLAHNPAFFERHAELLSTIQLTSPHGQRAVSLQERQMQMLRERIKGLEHRIVDMIRHGQENVTLSDRLDRCMRSMLRTQDAAALPAALTSQLQHEFMIPQAALRVWDVSRAFSGESFAREVGEEVRGFAAGLTAPYCGVNTGFEAARWLEESHSIQSLAMIPLRDASGSVFGLLVLGSPDPTRYSADMGTEFLSRLGELASAALSRLRH